MKKMILFALFIWTLGFQAFPFDCNQMPSFTIKVHTEPGGRIDNPCIIQDITLPFFVLKLYSDNTRFAQVYIDQLGIIINDNHIFDFIRDENSQTIGFSYSFNGNQTDVYYNSALNKQLTYLVAQSVISDIGERTHWENFRDNFPTSSNFQVLLQGCAINWGEMLKSIAWFLYPNPSRPMAPFHHYYFGYRNFSDPLQTDMAACLD